MSKLPATCMADAIKCKTLNVAKEMSESLNKQHKQVFYRPTYHDQLVSKLKKLNINRLTLGVENV